MYTYIHITIYMYMYTYIYMYIYIHMYNFSTTSLHPSLAEASRSELRPIRGAGSGFSKASFAPFFVLRAGLARAIPPLLVLGGGFLLLHALRGLGGLRCPVLEVLRGLLGHLNQLVQGSVHPLLLLFLLLLLLGLILLVLGLLLGRRSFALFSSTLFFFRASVSLAKLVSV